MLAWRGVEGDVITSLLPAFMLASAGIGAAFVVATTEALTDVPVRHAGVASGLLNTGHEIGGSVGVAGISTIAASSIASDKEWLE